MSDIKKHLEPLLNREPYKIIHAPCDSCAPAACCLQPEQEHLQWQKTHSHKHHCREILFVVSGSTITFSGNKFFYCPAGTLQLFPGYEAHNSFYFSGATGIHIWAKLQSSRLMCFVYETHSTQSAVTSSVIYSYSFNDTDLLERLNKAWDELHLQLPETVVEIEALCRLIFCSLYHNSDTVTDPQQEIMINIRKMLSDNCGRDIDLAYLARLAGYSKQHFMRKFKEINGCTVGKVIENSRLKELEVIPPGTPVKEIADRLGFESSAAYCHWRKNMLKKSQSGK